MNCRGGQFERNAPFSLSHWINTSRAHHPRLTASHAAGAKTQMAGAQRPDRGVAAVRRARGGPLGSRKQRLRWPRGGDGRRAGEGGGGGTSSAPGPVGPAEGPKCNPIRHPTLTGTARQGEGVRPTASGQQVPGRRGGPGDGDGCLFIVQHRGGGVRRPQTPSGRVGGAFGGRNRPPRSSRRPQPQDLTASAQPPITPKQTLPLPNTQPASVGGAEQAVAVISHYLEFISNGTKRY